MGWKHVVAAAALTCGLVPGLSAHDGPHTGRADATFKVGKNGQVKVGEDLIVGEVVVKKGTYAFDHRVEQESHIVTLTKVVKTSEQSGPLELRMRLMPSKAPMKRTAILAHEAADARSMYMTTVEVAGERGEHVLPPPGQ